MKSDLIKILDICMEESKHEPDLAAISNIAASTRYPIALMAELVRLLWLCGEKPEQFDKEVSALYE